MLVLRRRSGLPHRICDAYRPLQDCPSFFPTIEDFLWCKLCLVRSEGRATSTSLAGAGAGESFWRRAGGRSRPAPWQHLAPPHLASLAARSLATSSPSSHTLTTPCAGLAMDAFTLSDLQSYLAQYPAAHYSHGGREPLLYAVVLLLSLQFRCGGGRAGAAAITAAGSSQATHPALALPCLTRCPTPTAPPTALPLQRRRVLPR